MAARMAVKAMRLSPWGPDDFIICASFACGIVFFVGALIEAQAGLGRDIWTLRFDQITTFLKVFFICEVVYTVGLATIKLSILFFFLRVFHTTVLYKPLWATVVFNSLLGFTFVIVNLAQCRPISYFWDSWDGEHAGTCININAMAWAHAAINVGLDLWMLILPATQIFKLKLSLHKKLAVLLMFSVGAFLTAVSIIRLTSLVAFDDSTNVTVDYSGVAIYSTLEIQVGIMCACMPAVHQLGRHVMRSVWPGRVSTAASGSGRAGACSRTTGSQTVRRRNHDDEAAPTLATPAPSSSHTTEDAEDFDAGMSSQARLVKVLKPATGPRPENSFVMKERTGSGSFRGAY